MSYIGNKPSEKIIETNDIANQTVSPSKLTNGAPTWDSSGNLTASGNITAFSDQSLKKNVRPFYGALSSVMSIDGVKFEWVDSGDSSAGVIAQNIKWIIPEIVKENQTETGVLLSVNYNGLIGLLIEAVKDLKKEIDVLKAK